MRSNGVETPICQSHRMGWWVLSRCGGYQQGCDARATQVCGAGIGTTCQANDRTLLPAPFDVRTPT